MSVNLLKCELSAWRGAGDLCRWCNLHPPRGGRRFCSRECLDAFAMNHQYMRGRELILRWSRDCDCATGPHVLCNGCGECELLVNLRGDRITVNHVEPRMGIPCGEPNCIHHLENLEPLCWACHEQLNRLGNIRPQLDVWLRRHLPVEGWMALA